MKRVKGLTDLQIKFCKEYAKSLNATQAYLKAGYTVNSENGAASGSSALMRNPKIIQYLGELLDTDEVKVVHEIAKIAFATIADMIDVANNNFEVKPIREWPDRAICAVKKITVTTTKSGGIETQKTTIELYDKLGALEKLMKVLRIYPEEMSTMQALRVLGNDKLLLDGQAEGIVCELEELRERIKGRLRSLAKEQ